MRSALDLYNTFELDKEYEDIVARGVLMEPEENPITPETLKKHAEGQDEYQFIEAGDSFFVAQTGEYDGAVESWRIAYGVDTVDENTQLVWIGYRPEENTDGHDASKPWRNIIETLGGKS